MRFGGEVNGRLDLLIMPAILPAASVGLYSVATNVSWIPVAVAGALHLLVLPAAARRGEDGVRIVVAAARATIAAGLALGLAIALLAGVAVPFVYGADFSGSVEPVILLLPGSVAMAAAGILLAGLNAADRPLTAAAAQLPGVVITAVGLALFLKPGGIVAAAIVSSAAYTSVLVTGACLYRRATGIAWRRLLPGA
jgi:O-antigen/teichoic acid export membrane protein